jgi:hypothetical protein
MTLFLFFFLFVSYSSANQPPFERFQKAMNLSNYIWNDNTPNWDFIENQGMTAILKVSNDFAHPKFCFVQRNTEIWIVIRGTASEAEWKDNINLTEIYDENVKTRFHQGYHQEALYIWEKIKVVIPKNATILYITSHSRGRAIAQSAHVLIKYYLSQSEETKYLHNNVTSFIFAPVQNLVDVGYNKIGGGNMYVFLHEYDVIPYLSYNYMKGSEQQVMEMG